MVLPFLSSFHHLYFLGNLCFLFLLKTSYLPELKTLKNVISKHGNHCLLSLMINSIVRVLRIVEKNLTMFYIFLYFRLNAGYYTTLSVAEGKMKIGRSLLYSGKVNLCLVLKSQVIPQTASPGNNCK